MVPPRLGRSSGARRTPRRPGPTSSRPSTTSRSSSSAAGTASCAPSTTSAAIAARPSSRSRAARPSASSARTTPGSTTSTARWSGPSTPRTSTTSASTAYGLAPVRLATWQGFVFVNLDPDAPAARSTGSATSSPHLARFDFARLRVAARGDLRGRRELEVHRRELQRVLPLPGHPPAAQQADAVRPRRRLRARRAVAGRLDGARRGRRDDGPRRRPPRRPAGDARASPTLDERRIYYYLLWPSTFLSIHPDYLLVHRLEPAGAGHTRIVCQWLFEPETIAAPDFDPSDAVGFWDLTNRQDWHVCELQQRGTRSSSWVAGRYSNQEPSVHAFDLMAVDRYAERRRREPAGRSATATTSRRRSRATTPTGRARRRRRAGARHARSRRGGRAGR